MTPRSTWLTAAAALMLLCLTSGCGLGYNRVLFFTKSNVGVDIDPTPPTAELTIARREGVIEPTFENGKTLPVLASFTSGSNGASRLLFGKVETTFATGEAAIGLAKYYDVDADSSLAERQLQLQGLSKESPILVNTIPEGKGLLSFFQDKSPYKSGQMEPLIFGTDSAFGLKVGTSGQVVPSSAPLPTIVFGFRRKELAFTPVMASDEIATTDEERAQDPTLGVRAHRISMPSLIATMGGEYSGGADEDGVTNDVKYVQYFATGKAATYLSLQKAVRKPLLERMVPDLKNSGSPGELDEANRASVEDLSERTASLTPDALNGDPVAYGDTIEKLHTVAVALEFIDALDSFAADGVDFDDPDAVHVLRDELSAAFLAVAKKPLASETYASDIQALLALLP